jgi:hypothetical protein
MLYAIFYALNIFSRHVVLTQKAARINTSSELLIIRCCVKLHNGNLICKAHKTHATFAAQYSGPCDLLSAMQRGSYIQFHMEVERRVQVNDKLEALLWQSY